VAKEIHYRIDWRARSPHPGHHRSAQAGGGLEFLGLVPLAVARDPRRLDLRASLRDPYEQFLVRTFRQRSQVPVYVLADLSASIGYVGDKRKLDVLADLIESIAYSASRTGDRFACIGFDDKVLDDLSIAPSHFVGAGVELASRVRAFDPVGRGSSGLLAASAYLPRQRALVFLVSDLHMALAELENSLAALARHQLIPIVLWDPTEYRRLPKFGFATVQDSESGERRTLFLRARLRERIRQAFERRRAAIEAICLAYQAPPLFMESGFDADRLTRYFHERDLALATTVAA
jgi:uncharacterized protein (DUF58 family)